MLKLKGTLKYHHTYQFLFLHSKGCPPLPNLYIEVERDAGTIASVIIILMIIIIIEASHHHHHRHHQHHHQQHQVTST